MLDWGHCACGAGVVTVPAIERSGSWTESLLTFLNAARLASSGGP